MNVWQIGFKAFYFFVVFFLGFSSLPTLSLSISVLFGRGTIIVWSCFSWP